MPSIKARPSSKHPLCHEVVNSDLPAREDRHNTAGVLTCALNMDRFLYGARFPKSAECP